MLNLLKKQKPTPGDTEKEKKPAFFQRLKDGLAKTRQSLTAGLARVFLGKKALDADVLEMIENQLLLADVGVEVTQQLIQGLTEKLARRDLDNIESALTCLQHAMLELLTPYAKPLLPPKDAASPFVILVVGVNGAGKTTTIGKMAHHYQANGYSMMLAAGDTFRAAAIEQLQVWGERNHTPVVAQQPGADAAAVIYDALGSAKSRGTQLLLADTAGRLHTQTNLMEELKKIKRVLTKLDPKAPHETLLVLDASLGQNALNQANQFHQAIGITGLVMTKLDGTAKGGILLAIAKKLGLPIRFIGVGESLDDLQPFDAEAFVSALFTTTD